MGGGIRLRSLKVGRLLLASKLPSVRPPVVRVKLVSFSTSRNHVPDPDALRKLYIEMHGRVQDVAMRIGVTRTAVYNAIKRFGLDDILPVRSRRPHPEKGLERALPSNDQLAMAYVKSRYNWAAVADESGIAYATIYIRIDKALQNGASLLKLLIEVQRQIGHITDDHIAAVLITHELDLQRSAGFLRMTPDEILLRARQAPFGSHLHLMQGLKSK